MFDNYVSRGFRVNMLGIITLFLIVSCSCVLAQDEAKAEMDVFRLPNSTEPIDYTLKIQTIIEPKSNQFKFTGNVTINIRVKTTTKELILNAVDLEIKQIEISDTNLPTGTNIGSLSYSLSVKNEQLIIQLDQPGLIADRFYNVKITYSGQLRRDMTGFYLSSYLDEESQSTK